MAVVKNSSQTIFQSTVTLGNAPFHVLFSSFHKNHLAIAVNAPGKCTLK